MMDRDKIYALLRPFDIFGLVPLMTFARAPKVYSRLSMFLSLTTLAGVFFLCIYLGLAVVQRKNPSFFQYSLPSSGYKKIQFGPDTFPLKLMAPMGSLLFGPDYIWDAYVFSTVPSYQGWDFTEFPCNDPKFPDALCFGQTNFVGESFVTNSGADAFAINLFTCITPGMNGCSMPSQIDSQIAQTSMTISYTNKVVDPYDFENPIKDRVMTAVDALQVATFKQPTFYLQEIEVITDEGWLFESLRTQSALSVHEIQTYSSDVMGNRRAAVLVRYTGDKIVYKRSYPKIQDLLAEISGMVAVIIPVIAIFAFPYAEMKMREHMINELYEVKLPKRNPQKRPPGRPNGSGKSKNQAIQMQKMKENTKFDGKDGKTANELSVVPKTGPISPQTRSNLLPSGVQSLENSIVPMNGNDSVPGSPLNSPNKDSRTKFNNLKKRSRLVSPQFELPTPSERSASPEKPLDQKDQKDEATLLNKEVEEIEVKEEDEKLEEVIEVGEKSVFLNQARHTDKLNLTFGQFVKSYFRPQPEVEIIKKVADDLTDAMDLASLAKKSADLDKLKAILFSPEERAIFDNLPTSVVTVGDQEDNKKMEVSHYRWENSLRGNINKVNQAYVKLKSVDEKTDLQRKLLGFYESQYLEDYLKELHPEYYEDLK